jgi:hypothetical protein
MDLLTMEKFQQLIQHQRKLSLSIYMPAVKAGSEVSQNAVRFKNLVSEADKRLKESGMSTLDRKEYLKPVRSLFEHREFWEKQEKGLAVFLSKDFFEILRIPLEVEEVVVLDERFHIKPLLPLFVENERFYLLALSRKQIRLFAGTRFDLAQMSLPDTPVSLEDALQFDDPEHELQYQTAAAGGNAAVFHGHHPEGDQVDNIKRFFHMVDQGVMDAIGGESDPLIIAGLDYLHPIYRDANSYGELLEEGVYRNTDQSSLELIHQEAWTIIEKRIAKSQQEIVDVYYASDNQKTSDKLKDILPAAVNARIDTLLVDLSSEKWGMYDREKDQVRRISAESPESRDLVDQAVIHTLLNGGDVWTMPAGNIMENSFSGLAAIFRY